MSQANELLRKDGSAEINGLQDTLSAKSAFSGPNENTLTDRYEAGVEKAGVRRGGRRVRLRRLMLKAAERQGWRCMFCERQIAIWGKPAPVPEWACTVEHIVQRRDGGTDDARNIGAACWRCNHERGRTADLQAFRRLPTPEPSHD